MGPLLALAHYLRPAPWQRARALLRGMNRFLAAGGFLFIGFAALVSFDDGRATWMTAITMGTGMLFLAASHVLESGPYTEYEQLVVLYQGREDAPPYQAHLNYLFELELVRWALDAQTQALVRREELAKKVEGRGRNPPPAPPRM